MRFLQSLERGFRDVRDRFAPLFYGGDAFYCAACRRTARKFKPAGTGKKARKDAVCPFCRSRERDRLVMLFFDRHPELFPVNPPGLLHVAPEPALQKFLREKSGAGYLSADIYRKDVMERMDITDIRKPDNTFGAIYCSHVLQDVPDDDQALRELFRVLAPGGWAILNVPYYKGTRTVNLAPTIKDNNRPAECRREYGDDYLEQLRRVGFEVMEAGPADLWDKNDPRDPGLTHPMTGHVHLCRKPAVR